MMKTIFSCLAFAITFINAYGQLVSKKDTISLSGYGNTRPRIVSNAALQTVAVWGNEADGNLYSSVISGSTASVPVALIPSPMKAYVNFWTSHEVVSFGNTIYVVFKAIPEASGGIYLVKSTDGGSTFSAPVRIDKPSTNIPWLPSVSVDDAGNPVVAYMDNDSGWLNPRYVLTSSPDGGATWTTPVNATEGVAPGEVCDCCPATVLARGSERYIAFRNNESNIRTIYVSSSIDNGVTFDISSQVDQTNTYSNQCQSTGPDMEIFMDSLYTTWRGSSGGYRIFISSASTPDASVGSHVRLSPNIASNISQNYPRISSNDSLLVLAWQELTPASPNVAANTDILFSFSTSGAEGFVVRDTVTNLKGHQINPDVTHITGSEFALAWQDNQNGTVNFSRVVVDPLYNSVTSRQSLAVSVYPVPADKEVVLHIPAAGAGYTIRNTFGQLLREGKLPYGVSSLDVTDVPAGVYVLEVSASAGRAVERIVVTH